MRAAVAQAARHGEAGHSSLPSSVLAVRHYFAPQSLSFSEDVAIAKPATKDSRSFLEEWKGKKAGTEHMLRLMQSYKEVGDAKNEPYLKPHNLRTYEDFTKPVPNFRAMNLKAGEVPRFFDGVLSSRASDAVAQKDAWWATRKAEAEAAMQNKSAQPFPTVPVPQWNYGKSVSMNSLQSTTDAYIKALEPKRKLQLAPLPDQVKESIASFASALKQDSAAPEVTDLVMKAFAEKAVVLEEGKPVEGFKYVSEAVAAKVVATRRAQVHDRYLKYWAKKVLISPELALVPMKEVDNQLASKFEGVAPAYADVLSAAGAGPNTFAERLAASPAFSKFFLKRETVADVEQDVPATEAEQQAKQLAVKLESPEEALKAMLGPEIDALGSGQGPLSAQVRAITEHKYTADRLMYREGMKLAARLEEEEAALRKELQPVYGDNVDVAQHQRSPLSPVQKVLNRTKAIAAKNAEFEAAIKAADTPYMKDVLAKKQEFMKDASNMPLEELLAPEVVTEKMEIELAELAELEAAINDAEEEELWSLTLAAQLKHLQKHFGVDLPHGVIAHMDPILVKKIDWETTNNLEDWDITLDELGSEYAKEQWALETLSHHFLPLIRYRRAKAQAAGVPFTPELSSPLR